RITPPTDRSSRLEALDSVPRRTDRVAATGPSARTSESAELLRAKRRENVIKCERLQPTSCGRRLSRVVAGRCGRYECIVARPVAVGLCVRARIGIEDVGRRETDDPSKRKGDLRKDRVLMGQVEPEVLQGSEGM